MTSFTEFRSKDLGGALGVVSLIIDDRFPAPSKFSPLPAGGRRRVNEKTDAFKALFVLFTPSSRNAKYCFS
jgi:hypothetical protein